MLNAIPRKKKQNEVWWGFDQQATYSRLPFYRFHISNYRSPNSSSSVSIPWNKKHWAGGGYGGHHHLALATTRSTQPIAVKSRYRVSDRGPIAFAASACPNIAETGLKNVSRNVLSSTLTCLNWVFRKCPCPTFPTRKFTRIIRASEMYGVQGTYGCIIPGLFS